MKPFQYAKYLPTESPYTINLRLCFTDSKDILTLKISGLIPTLGDWSMGDTLRDQPKIEQSTQTPNCCAGIDLNLTPRLRK